MQPRLVQQKISYYPLEKDHLHVKKQRKPKNGYMQLTVKPGSIHYLIQFSIVNNTNVLKLSEDKEKSKSRSVVYTQ